MFEPSQKFDAIRDWRDDIAARRKRVSLGLDRMLISWSQEADGRWLARLSGPSVTETIETYGKSRLEAIKAAEAEYERSETDALADLPKINPER